MSRNTVEHRMNTVFANSSGVACAAAPIQLNVVEPSPPGRRLSPMQEQLISRLQRIATRIVVLAALTVLSMGLGGGQAQAHSAANSPASNYRTKLLAVTPASNAYQAKVIETGNRFELRWKSGPELMVPDYDDHPYLRIGPNGVEENQQSNAKYLNNSRLGSTPPDGLKPEGPPQWKRISTEPVARWHDHRIHRMTAELPEPVAKDPNKSHVIDTAPVVFSAGSTLVTATTEMRWNPGPSALPYWVLAGLLAVVTLGAALWARNNLRRRRSAIRIICALSFVLVAVDVLHLVGISFGVVGPLGQALGRMVTVGFVSLAAWAIVLIGIVLALRNRLDAPYLLTFGAALMGVVGGVADVGVLSKSSLPVAFGDGGPALIRVLIAVTIGLGLGIALAGVMLTTPIRVLPNPSPLGEVGLPSSYPDLLDNAGSRAGAPDAAIPTSKRQGKAKGQAKGQAKSQAKGWDLD
jgi:hypothetical protein